VNSGAEIKQDAAVTIIASLQERARLAGLLIAVEDYFADAPFLFFRRRGVR